jgi:hypothetical protein
VGIRLSRCDLQHIRISRYLFEAAVTDAELIEVLENHRQLLLMLHQESGRRSRSWIALTHTACLRASVTFKRSGIVRWKTSSMSRH